MPFKADRRLYHNADKSKIVEEDDPEASFLAIGEGQEVPDAEAKRLGLDKIETKQLKGPPEDKGGPASGGRAADEPADESGAGARGTRRAP
jgi:hypothetical protein